MKEEYVLYTESKNEGLIPIVKSCFRDIVEESEAILLQAGYKCEIHRRMVPLS